jgi:hypothetical protein
MREDFGEIHHCSTNSGYLESKQYDIKNRKKRLPGTEKAHNHPPKKKNPSLSSTYHAQDPAIDRPRSNRGRSIISGRKVG